MGNEEGKVSDQPIYKMRRDIYIKDDEINGLAEETSDYMTYAKEIQEYIEEYYEIMQDLYNNGIEAGEFHDKIGKFNEIIQKIMEDGIINITNEITSQIESFMEDFDVADNCLY